MKKIGKILGIILLIIIGLYLVSIPYMRSENVIKEALFFTATKYDSTKIFNQLDSKYLQFITKEEVNKAAHKFISQKGVDSVKLNNTTIIRGYHEFTVGSNSEFYTLKPEIVVKTGIFMMGNEFNVFNMLDDLTELSKRDSAQIFIITYNGSGLSVGKSDFATQFKVNQAYYEFVNNQNAVDFVGGHSLGTVFATKLAVDNHIPTLALLAPASNIDDIEEHVKEPAPFWAKPYFNFSEIKKSEVATLGNSSENIKRYFGKLILSHGTKDENLPFSMSEKIFNNCPTKEKSFLKIEDGDHYAALTEQNWKQIMDKLK